MPIELVSDLLIAAASQHGDRTAVIAPEGEFTYDRLNREVNRFANGLLARGVKPGDRILVNLPKNITPIIAMFGIMKAGAVMVPVAAYFPQGRIDAIREDAQPLFTLTADGAGDSVAFRDVMEGQADTEPPRPDADGLSSCLIIYTSGSTGAPKGVMLRHRGFLNTLTARKENRLSMAAKEHGSMLLGVTGVTFIFFYIEYTICVANAITYIMADSEHSRSPMLMAEYMARYKVDILTGTPSRMMQYLNIPVYHEAFKTVNIIAVGGERIPDGFAEAVHKASPRCIILNGYSQTEGNASMFAAAVDSADSHLFPAYGWKFLALGEDNRPVSPGTTGELVMAGDNLMAGYLNLEKEMQAKTVEVDGVKYFRTGDLVVLYEDGGCRVVGRKDQQIKLRGLRMEPGEIEKVIQSFPGVRIEKALAKVNIINNAEHLVAYYTGDGPADEKALRAHLANVLTPYMIPDYFKYLPQFPLNVNFKIDLLHLPEIEVNALEIVAPADDTEAFLLADCKKIVRFEDFGVTTPLSDAGFTSLLYINLASDILDNYGVELKLTEMMGQEITVRSLAEKIRSSEVLRSEETEKKEKYPLTPQMRQFTIKNPTADMYRKFEFSEKWPDAKAVRAAFLKVFNTFPYLYTILRKEGDDWFQIPYRGELLKEEDLEIRPGEPTEAELDAFCTPFDVGSADRLFDLRVYQGEKVVILLHIQHALMDHVFVEKLIANVRRVLLDPSAKVTENADYFAYTDAVMAAAPAQEQTLPAEEPLFRAEPCPMGETVTLRKGLGRKNLLDPVMDKFRIQPADYLFSLISQAYLEVMDKEETVFYNVFGGRNNARYFNTAGFFPIHMAIPVRRDARAHEEISRKIVEAINRVKPQGDLMYRMVQKGRAPYPHLVFNCMEYIEENEDFTLTSLFSKRIELDPLALAARAQMDFLCFSIGDSVLAIVLTFDKNFISEEKANALLEKVEEIAQRNLKTV